MSSSAGSGDRHLCFEDDKNLNVEKPVLSNSTPANRPHPHAPVFIAHKERLFSHSGCSAQLRVPRSRAMSVGRDVG